MVRQSFAGREVLEKAKGLQVGSDASGERRDSLGGGNFIHSLSEPCPETVKSCGEVLQVTGLR